MLSKSIKGISGGHQPCPAPSHSGGSDEPGEAGGILRMALAQVCASRDPMENLALVRDQAVRAKENGAGLVIFPEAMMASFTRCCVEVAEPVDGPWANAVRGVARENSIAIIAGMFTPGAGRHDDPHRPRVRNTLLFVGADGELVATYDKIHLFDALGFAESNDVEPGHDPVVANLSDVRIGLATCYDVRFPEMAKFLAGHGAQVLVVPASWADGPGKSRQWHALCVARAMDSTCYVVGTGQATPASVGQRVPPGSPTGVGHSIVVNPLGEVVAEAGAGPELLVVDIDVAEVAAARAQVPLLATSPFAILAPT